MIILNKILIFTLLITNLQSWSQIEEPIIDFIKEEVSLHCFSDQIEVEGNYYFRNNTNKIVSIEVFYPFPVDSNAHFPHDIYVDAYEYITEKNGISWKMKFDEFETKSFLVKYDQEISKNYAKYILFTSKKWENPIVNAKFTVSVPKEFKNVSLSYKYDEKTKKNERVYYIIEINDLHTSKDLTIEWD